MACVGLRGAAGWNDLPLSEWPILKRRQGLAYHLQDKVTVLDPETMKPVPHDARRVAR